MELRETGIEGPTDMIRLSRTAFERLVAAALDDLPSDFASAIQDVEVTIEDRPSPADVEGMPPGSRRMLLGLYRGVPLTKRSVWAAPRSPNRIVIFRRPIERAASTRRQVVELVRSTVLHEIAHHFGISDERLRELGLG